MMWSGIHGVGWRAATTGFAGGLALVMAACSGGDSSTPGGPSPSAPTVVSVAVTGTDTFTQIGATAQFTAMATLSNNTTENRTSTATWQSDNPAIATVSSQGLVTIISGGQTTISATVSNIKGARSISVARRTPDPAPGQPLPLPDIAAFIEQTAAARPDLLLTQSCPNGIKYVNNPWLDYMVDQLRTLDTRWGYNAKPTRTAADNGGVPVVAAGDEIAYHFDAGTDEGSTSVYLIDILEQHCGSTPKLTYRHFTGEEPGRWTGAGRF